MREPRQRAQSIPKPETPTERRFLAQPADAVALPVDRMPQRDEQPGFCEKEKENAVHDCQRLFERRAEPRGILLPRREGGQQLA